MSEPRYYRCSITRDQSWRLPNGNLHRLDGPAYIYDYAKEWWQNGELHRLDGPAIEYLDGVVEWYKNDDYFGKGFEGFSLFWERLDETQRQNVNLHIWLARLQNV